MDSHLILSLAFQQLPIAQSIGMTEARLSYSHDNAAFQISTSPTDSSFYPYMQ